jgi:hypothetical protein
MKCSFDFSIFSGPTVAFGNVSGTLVVPDDIKKGEVVSVLNERLRLRVEEIGHHADYGVVLSLEGVVLESEEEAVSLAALLENELGYFVDVYR